MKYFCIFFKNKFWKYYKIFIWLLLNVVFSQVCYDSAIVSWFLLFYRGLHLKKLCSILSDYFWWVLNWSCMLSYVIALSAFLINHNFVCLGKMFYRKQIVGFKIFSSYSIFLTKCFCFLCCKSWLQCANCACAEVFFRSFMFIRWFFF